MTNHGDTPSTRHYGVLLAAMCALSGLSLFAADRIGDARGHDRSVVAHLDLDDGAERVELAATAAGPPAHTGPSTGSARYAFSR